MDGTRLHRIDAGGVDARMPEQIGKADDILLQTVIGARKEMAQIVRKNLALRYARTFAKSLHIRPDVGTVKRPSAFRYENGTAWDPAPFEIG